MDFSGDAGILGNHKAVEKIHKKWSNTKQNFDFYFIRDQKAFKFVQQGEVDQDWVKKNLGEDIPPNPNAITIIFTNNTGVEKIPMTAWMIAHRMGHVFSQNNSLFYNEIMRDINYPRP